MSFQAYLDNIEEKTGRTPRQFIDEGPERGTAHAILARLGYRGGL